MFNVIGDINWIAVVLATLACTVLGGLWFAALFSKQYAQALGRDPSKKPVMSPLFMFGPMVCTLAITITSAVLIQVLNITSFSDGLMFGLIVGIGYIGSTMLNVAINPNFPKPLSYAAVNAPYFILCSVIISSVLVAFN